MLSSKTIEKFWKRVNKTEGCWLWNSSLDAYGYGAFRVDGLRIRAHRASWEIAHGKKPRLWVLHKCDNPQCVRPSHLFQGTRQDNIMDAKEKGRIQSGTQHWTQRMTEKLAIGSRHGQSKLAVGDVNRIRQLHFVKGLSQRNLASMFSVKRGTIWALLAGKTWRHVAC